MSERILIVDDDTEMRDTLREILEDAGFSVTTAADGLLALTEIEASIPDLVISDISMPRMDGHGLYEAVRAREQWAQLPFIFVSGLGERDEIRQGKLLGVDDYLVKPVDEEDLLVAVRGTLERHARVKKGSHFEVSELKKNLLSVLNHEILTPLTSIVGSADMLRESGHGLPPKALRGFLDGILTGSDRLRRLAEDFMFLVDIESGVLQENFVRDRAPIADLTAVLRAVLEVEGANAVTRGIRLVAEVPAGLPSVMGRPELLRAAVGHVLSNAIKFSRKGDGEVTLGARADAARVTIEVRDQGIGIPSEELERVTEMFYQWDRARREQQGTGSGLFIAQSIVALHGGRLSLASEAGVGTAVTIELPVTA
jgi:signal transduction histidine kinase